jgi:hypothetical protein
MTFAVHNFFGLCKRAGEKAVHDQLQGREAKSNCGEGIRKGLLQSPGASDDGSHNHADVVSGRGGKGNDEGDDGLVA